MLSVKELAVMLIDGGSSLHRDEFMGQYSDAADIREAVSRYDHATTVVAAVSAMRKGIAQDEFVAMSPYHTAVCKWAWSMGRDILGDAIPPRYVVVPGNDTATLIAMVRALDAKLDTLLQALAEDDEDPDTPSVQTLDGTQAYPERDGSQPL